MKTSHLLISAGLLFGQLVAHAESPVATEEPTAADQAVAQDTAPTILADHELPKLVVSWDCGACEHNEKVPPLIEKEYADYAMAHGYTVSASETADVVIVEYHQRPPAARAMLALLQVKIG